MKVPAISASIFAALHLCERLLFPRKAAKSLCLFAAGLAFVGIAIQAQKLDSSRERNLSDLADAERAFAATTVKEGFRDGFIKFFADDGIGFGPHPEKTRGKLLQSPPATGPRRVIFNWSPMFGDISAAGDLGYSTGPLLYTDTGENPRPPRHGTYFSVWQKQADGIWKVAIDMGIDTPNAVGQIDGPFITVQTLKGSGKFQLKGTPSDDYRNLDSELGSSIAKKSPETAYLRILDTQFRIHRKGLMPITGRSGLSAVLKQNKFEFTDGKIALSGDLAFTYGKYNALNETEIEIGYYVHVWRRDENGKWKLVADIQNPLPPSK